MKHGGFSPSRCDDGWIEREWVRTGDADGGFITWASPSIRTRGWRTRPSTCRHHAVVRRPTPICASHPQVGHETDLSGANRGSGAGIDGSRGRCDRCLRHRGWRAWPVGPVAHLTAPGRGRLSRHTGRRRWRSCRWARYCRSHDVRGRRHSDGYPRLCLARGRSTPRGQTTDRCGRKRTDRSQDYFRFVARQPLARPIHRAHPAQPSQ
jgi:hypothetical protein